MTHDELQDSLAAHLRGTADRVVWTNMQLGPSGSPRPDVFTVNKSYSRFRTDCYECKVSLSDLRHDVTSGKWQSYRAFGHAVWFAFPRGMAPLDLVPRECGVILLGDGWRATRKPVAQVLDTLPREAWLKLLFDGIERAVQAEPRTRSLSHWHATDRVRREFGEELAQLLSKRQDARYQYQAATTRLETQTAELADEHKRRRESWERDQARAGQRLTEAQAGLAEVLGLDPDGLSPERLTRALQDLRWTLAPHLGAAIKNLTDIREALEKVAKPEGQAA